MLYTSTRNNAATYTARRALKEERTPDGGLYLPARLPVFLPGELDTLLNQAPEDIVAQILNRFFGTAITGAEVLSVAGQQVYGLSYAGYRLLAGELWRNGAGGFNGFCRKLSSMICAERSHCVPGMWMRIACRIALTFAVFGELHRMDLDLEPLDVGVLTENFEAPHALWMARSMGLNIGTIVCCSNGNGFVWDLMYRGQLRLKGPLAATYTPEADGMHPDALELYCHSVLGWDGTQFAQMTGRRNLHTFAEEEHRALANGVCAAVVGEERVLRAIPNLYRSCGYVLCPYSALIYTGLEDYRSRSGQIRGALMLTERDPRACEELVKKALGLTGPELWDWCRSG